MLPELGQPPYSPRHYRDLLEACPDRKIIERVWECALHHHGTTRAPFTITDLDVLLKDLFNDRPNSVSSYSRAHVKHPLLLPWPIERGMRPPWEGVEPDEAAIVVVDQDRAALGQLGTDEDGVLYAGGHPVEVNGDPVEITEDGLLRVRLSRALHVLRNPRLTMVAAGFVVYPVLDGADGRYDGIVHWCHVFAGIVQRIGT